MRVLILCALCCASFSGCSVRIIKSTWQSISKNITLPESGQCGGQLIDNGGTLQEQDILNYGFCTPSDGYFFSLTFDI